MWCRFDDQNKLKRRWCGCYTELCDISPSSPTSAATQLQLVYHDTLRAPLVSVSILHMLLPTATSGHIRCWIGRWYEVITASLLQFSSAGKNHDNKTSHHIPLNKRPPCRSPFPKTLSCMKGGKGSLVFHLLSNRICMHVDLTPKKKRARNHAWHMYEACTSNVFSLLSSCSSYIIQQKGPLFDPNQ